MGRTDIWSTEFVCVMAPIRRVSSAFDMKKAESRGCYACLRIGIGSFEAEGIILKINGATKQLSFCRENPKGGHPLVFFTLWIESRYEILFDKKELVAVLMMDVRNASCLTRALLDDCGIYAHTNLRDPSMRILFENGNPGTGNLPKIMQMLGWDGRSPSSRFWAADVFPTLDRFKSLQNGCGSARGRLLDELLSEDPDVVLVSLEGKRLWAHKAVLSTRSSVFLNILSKNVKGNPNNIIEMRDYSTGSLETFLELIYARPFPALKEHLFPVLQLLDVYRIGSLKSIGDVELLDFIDKDNAGELFFLATKHKHDELLAASAKFITANKLDISNLHPEGSGGIVLDCSQMNVIFKASQY